MAEVGVASGGSSVIVVVDDDRVGRRYVAEVLAATGANVETCGSGRECVERVRKGDVDLVVLDVVMPGMDGIECCRLLKEITRGGFLPVLLLTAKVDLDSRIEGLRIGADDYLSKPVDEKDLVMRVETMLRLKRMHDGVTAAKSRLSQLSMRDEITGLHNARYARVRMGEEFKRAVRYRDPLACTVVELSGSADAVARRRALMAAATEIRGALRETDIIARFDRGDFLVLHPGTHFSGALVVARRVWLSLSSNPALPGAALGIAIYPSRDVKTEAQLVDSALAALAQARESGADRIGVFQHQGYVYRPSIPSPSD